MLVRDEDKQMSVSPDLRGRPDGKDNSIAVVCGT